MKYFWNRTAVVLLFALACGVMSGCTQTRDGVAVSAIRVGKADAILLKTERSAVLIDTGSYAQRETVAQFLEDAGITRLDALIITHFDRDHVGGAQYLIRRFEIGAVYQPDTAEDSDEYEAYVSALSAADILPVTLSEDTVFSIDGVDYTVLTAHGETYEKESNDRSLVVRAVCAGRKLLFCGDIEGQRIRELLESGYDLSCDLIKLPHHGRYDESLPALIAACAPEAALICTSEERPPDEQTLGVLSDAGCRVYTTVEDHVHLICTESGVRAVE